MNEELFQILDISSILLTRIFFKMRDVEIELGRVNEVASAILKLGFSKDDEIDKLLRDNSQFQNNIDVGEIIYFLDFLSNFPDYHNEKKRLIAHLFLSLNKDGGIGRFVGDRSRIPVCWRLLETLYFNDHKYDENIKRIINWMEKEWTKDSIRGGLSYKCSGILIANSYYPYFDKEFIRKCLNWVLSDQNKDGGWGPKKNSPVSSRPTDTALALRAILNYPSDKTDKAIKNGLNWILVNRLNSGFWNEHPVEKPLIYISLLLKKYLENDKANN